jgi:hypothetical protein
VARYHEGAIKTLWSLGGVGKVTRFNLQLELFIVVEIRMGGQVEWARHWESSGEDEGRAACEVSLRQPQVIPMSDGILRGLIFDQ